MALVTSRSFETYFLLKQASQSLLYLVESTRQLVEVPQESDRSGEVALLQDRVGSEVLYGVVLEEVDGSLNTCSLHHNRRRVTAH
eukprot:757002-Hanusia_phi.AAC.2